MIGVFVSNKEGNIIERGKKRKLSSYVIGVKIKDIGLFAIGASTKK